MNPKTKKPAESTAAAMLETFRQHAAVLRSQGAVAVTASFGPDIVFTVNYPEGEEPRTFH